jgi:hypothetical protein
MQPILNKILFLSFFLVSSMTYALDCQKSKIQYITFGIKSVENSYFCTNQYKDLIISNNCKNKKCYAYKASHLKYRVSSLSSEVGKPGFKLCRKLKGKPQIIRFLVLKKWYKLDRCIFSTDNSYIDSGSLLKFYLE